MQVYTTQQPHWTQLVQTSLYDTRGAEHYRVCVLHIYVLHLMYVYCVFLSILCPHTSKRLFLLVLVATQNNDNMIRNTNNSLTHSRRNTCMYAYTHTACQGWREESDIHTFTSGSGYGVSLGPVDGAPLSSSWILPTITAKVEVVQRKI